MPIITLNRGGTSSPPASGGANSDDLDALADRVSDLEDSAANLIDLRGESVISESAIGSAVRMDRDFTLPAADFADGRKFIDILSDATVTIVPTGASASVVVDNRTREQPGQAAAAILIATNTWRIIGAL